MCDTSISSQASQECVEGSEIRINHPEREMKSLESSDSKRPTPNDVSWVDDMIQSSRKREAVLKRLMLNMKTTHGGCWEWQGAKTKDGYGYFREKSLGLVFMMPHRASVVLFKTHWLTDEEIVCHKCDNRICFNPEHLFIGEDFDNQADKTKKGRALYGTNVKNSKFSDELIEKALSYLHKGITQKKVSELTGISCTQLSRVKRGQSRSHTTNINHKQLHGNSDLTIEALQEVANLILEGKLTNAEIADKANVPFYVIGDMKRGHSHKKFLERAKINALS